MEEGADLVAVDAVVEAEVDADPADAEAIAAGCATDNRCITSLICARGSRPPATF